MIRLIMLLFACSLMSSALAADSNSERYLQFSNLKVVVWETVIQPGKHQELKMHRHNDDRVVVALTDGKLKITNNLGEVKYFTFEKDKAYFFPKDPADHFHTDENISDHPIKVMVINLV